MVGHDGFGAAWLLVQHADSDPAFQERMLATLVERKRIDGEQLALLTDRVLRAQGRPQRYGSQFTSEEGRWMVQPVEAPVADLDRRRAALGLMPFADYRCTMEAMYPAPETRPALSVVVAHRSVAQDVSHRGDPRAGRRAHTEIPPMSQRRWMHVTFHAR